MNVRVAVLVSAVVVPLTAACARRAPAPVASPASPPVATVAAPPSSGVGEPSVGVSRVGVSRVGVPSVVGPVEVAPTAPSADGWSAATPVGRIVAERPSAARVLERAGIDYCCGGAVSLGDAVRARGGDLTALLAELAAVRDTPPAATERVFTDAPLPELLAHIEATHHAFLRKELPRLAPLVEKVRVVHGAAHPELEEVAKVFATLAADLPPHLELEERRLFPAIVALDAGRPAPAADVLPALTEMEAQHDGAGAALHRLHELTKGYVVPEDACASYRQLLTGLASLEADLHAHVHLENNVLAPRVKALARR